MCARSCSTLATDPTNCGMCGRVCPSGQSCVAGACTLVCPDGPGRLRRRVLRRADRQLQLRRVRNGLPPRGDLHRGRVPAHLPHGSERVQRRVHRHLARPVELRRVRNRVPLGVLQRTLRQRRGHRQRAVQRLPALHLGARVLLGRAHGAPHQREHELPALRVAAAGDRRHPSPARERRADRARARPRLRPRPRRLGAVLGRGLRRGLRRGALDDPTDPRALRGELLRRHHGGDGLHLGRHPARIDGACHGRHGRHQRGRGRGRRGLRLRATQRQLRRVLGHGHERAARQRREPHERDARLGDGPHDRDADHRGLQPRVRAPHGRNGRVLGSQHGGTARRRHHHHAQRAGGGHGAHGRDAGPRGHQPHLRGALRRLGALLGREQLGPDRQRRHRALADDARRRGGPRALARRGAVRAPHLRRRT